MKLRNMKCETSVLEVGNSGIEYKIERERERNEDGTVSGRHERKRRRMHHASNTQFVWCDYIAYIRSCKERNCRRVRNIATRNFLTFLEQVGTFILTSFGYQTVWCGRY
jgi:hypothetical protein